MKKIIIFWVFVFTTPLLFSQSKPPKWFDKDVQLDKLKFNIVYSSGMATRKNEEEARRIAEYNAYKKLKRRLGESEIPIQTESEIITNEILEQIYKRDRRSNNFVCHKAIHSIKGDEVTVYVLLQYQSDFTETPYFEKFDCENYGKQSFNWSLAGGYGLGISTKRSSDEELFLAHVANVVLKAGYGQFGVGVSADIGGIGESGIGLEDHYPYWSLKGRIYPLNLFYFSCGYGTVTPEFIPSQMPEDTSNWIIEGYELKQGWSIGAGIDWRFGKRKVLGKLGCSTDYDLQTKTLLIFLNIGISLGK